MAIPLKNGADLYNFEVLRMRFQNLGADPASDFGVGQVYFNTSTSEGSGKRLRIYDGSAFRSLAYFDEIDNRLKLLEGEIDTDAIISNMKEVSAFLAGFAEDASLMDALNGKLDKTGGTMSLASISSFMINRTDAGSPAIGFSSNGAYWGSIGFSSNGVPVFYDGAQVKYNFIHSGNVGEYKAGDSDKLGGRTLAWVQGNGLKIRRVKTAVLASPADANVDLNGGGMIYSYSNTSSYLTNGPSNMGYGHIWQVGSYGNDALDGQFAWDSNHGSQEDTTGKLWWRSRDTSGWTYAKWHQIAFTDSNVASATKLKTARTIWGQSFDGTGDITGSLLLNNNVSIYVKNTSGSFKDAFKISSSDNFIIGYGVSAAGYNTYLEGNNVFLRYGQSHATGLILNSSGNVTIGSSDLAGTSEFFNVKNLLGLYSSRANGPAAKLNIHEASDVVNGVHLFVGSNTDTHTDDRPLILQSGYGNVIIGTTTDDGSGAKLQVNGHVALKGIRLYHQKKSTTEVGNYLWQYYESGDSNLLALTSRDTAGAFKTWIITTNWDNGNVGIGTGDPQHKLDVNGDLHVKGNIIADGEVSAGGAGEEGDAGTGTGGGDALIYSQEFTPTTTSITITHNLSATKGVIVQVWEKNGNYWDMVLVDVEEVDTNTVTLFFGKTETTLHKVVIMG